MTLAQPTAQPSTASQDQLDAIARIRSVLGTYDLDSEADWAWSEIVNGVSETQFFQDLRQRDAYKTRFSGMADRQAAGLPAISPGEYITYERQAYQLMLAAGMPPEFRTREYFAKLIGQDRSINELSSSITNAYLAVAQAPPAVRQSFAEYFGGDGGDRALAAMILDGEHSGAALDRMAQEAVVGGTASAFGFHVGQGLAEQIVQRGLAAQAPSAFGQAGDQRALATETIGEANQPDLTNDDIIASSFGLDQASKDAVRKRQETRAAAFGGRNDSLLTQQGDLSLGEVQR